MKSILSTLLIGIATFVNLSAQDIPKVALEAEVSESAIEYLRSSDEQASRPTDDDLFLASIYTLRKISVRDDTQTANAIKSLANLKDLIERVDEIIQKPGLEREVYINRKFVFNSLFRVKQRRVVAYLTSLLDQTEAPVIDLGADTVGPISNAVVALSTLNKMEIPGAPTLKEEWRQPVDYAAAQAAWTLWLTNHGGTLEP